MRWLALALLVGCGHAPPPPEPDPEPEPGPGFVAIELDTDPGLSDLAFGPDGALWTLSERGRTVYKLTIGGDRVESMQKFGLWNVPDGTDTEALAVLPDGRFAIGTETHGTGSAGILFADVVDLDLQARGGFAFTPQLIQVDVEDNRGVEGACGDDTQIVAAIETVIEDGDERYAPVIVQRHDLADDLIAPDVHKVHLTSTTGKLSALRCMFHDQTIDVLAIERHYDVSRIISFTLPRAGGGIVEAEVVRDLTPIADDRNFEGLALLPDGRTALVVDNQTSAITGPSELVLLEPP